jgi:hypothetical protein
MVTQLKGLASKRPTSGISPFDLLNGRVSTYFSTRDRQRTYEFVRLLRDIRDFNPDASKAVENIMTLANPGYTLKVFKNQFNKDDPPEPDYEAQVLVEQFANRINGQYSGAFDFENTGEKYFPGLDSFINMINIVVFTQGAFACEVQLTSDLGDIEDVYVVDPVWIDFRKEDPDYKWIPGIYAVFEKDKYIKGFFPLNTTMFRYIPYEPDVDQPAGRSPMAATLDIIFFQQQVYRELQAIAHQTNVPRLDVSISSEQIAQILNNERPDLLEVGNEVARQKYLDGIVADVNTIIQNLEADDAFIHWDVATAQYIAPQHLSIPVKDLMDSIDKNIVSALKQLPILLGRNEGATTTHATVQWQVYIKQIESFQKVSRNIVTWLFNLFLRVHGFDSHIDFEFEKHKTSDDFLDAQAMNMNVMTWQTLVNNGWASADEAANKLLGHSAVGDPVQIKPQSGLPGQPAAVVQDASQKAGQE